MSIEVISPGLSTTVQDLGRYGYQQYGVSVGGAMDEWALQMANLLVGNSYEEAVLEVTLVGPTLLFHSDMLIAVCGGDFSPTINQNPVLSNRPVWVKSGSVLQFGHARKGCRAYLAVAGGWDVPVVMGSRSTNVRGGFGGFAGRMLKAGDQLSHYPGRPFGRFLAQQLGKKAGTAPFAAAKWFISAERFRVDSKAEAVVRVIRGEQFDDFSAASQQSFFEQSFRVSPQSDRMGYRLTGPMLTLASPRELISAAVTAGTIQVPPNGQPIILMADRQTIGGYPKIGYVARVDVGLVAQLRPGEAIRFVEISLRDAQLALSERDKRVKDIKLGMEVQVGWR